MAIGSSLVSFQMIFEALQSELVIFNFNLMRSKVSDSKLQKIPEFNLAITYGRLVMIIEKDFEVKCTIMTEIKPS